MCRAQLLRADLNHANLSEAKLASADVSDADCSAATMIRARASLHSPFLRLHIPESGRARVSFREERRGDNVNSYYLYEVVSNGIAVYLLLERCGTLAEQKSSG